MPLVRFNRRQLFFPVGWANALVRWVSGIRSPSGTVSIKNTLTPTEAGSMGLDVNLDLLAEEIADKLISTYGFGGLMDAIGADDGSDADDGSGADDGTDDGGDGDEGTFIDMCFVHFEYYEGRAYYHWEVTTHLGKRFWDIALTISHIKNKKDDGEEPPDWEFADVEGDGLPQRQDGGEDEGEGEGGNVNAEGYANGEVVPEEFVLSKELLPKKRLHVKFEVFEVLFTYKGVERVLCNKGADFWEMAFKKGHYNEEPPDEHLDWYDSETKAPVPRIPDPQMPGQFKPYPVEKNMSVYIYNGEDDPGEDWEEGGEIPPEDTRPYAVFWNDITGERVSLRADPETTIVSLCPWTLDDRHWIWYFGGGPDDWVREDDTVGEGVWVVYMEG